MKTCCIIFNQPRVDALPDELDVLEQVEFIEQNLGQIGIKTYRKGITAGFMTEIGTLADEKPDFVFNLVESIDNKGELNYFIPALLNMYRIPYSGNPLEAIFLTTSKALTGKILREKNISTPGTFLPSEINKLIPGNKYIIKPVWEDGSLGITGDSVFTYDEDTVMKLSEYDDCHWIIQDFIDGREFNISVIYGQNGPEVMPPAEMIFHNYDDSRPRIVDFRAKWVEGSFEYENTVRDFPGEDLKPELLKRINEAALNCWHVFGLKGYARVDMRVDNNDIPYVIEVNANPCLSPGSGLAAATSRAGMPMTEVLKRIIQDLNH